MQSCHIWACEYNAVQIEPIYWREVHSDKKKILTQQGESQGCTARGATPIGCSMHMLGQQGSH